jgi:hypothetical protein
VQQTLTGSLMPEAPATPRSPTILQGSGSFTAPPVENPDAMPSSADGFQLSFVDVDVPTVVGAILGDGLGVPYVVDPQVKGTITLQASRRLPARSCCPRSRPHCEFRALPSLSWRACTTWFLSKMLRAE